MKVKTTLASSAVALSLLAPAAADAHDVSSSQSVRAHVRAAERSLLEFESSVNVGAETSAARALHRNRRQMRAAAREARRVRRAARGPRATKRSATATARVGLEAATSAGVLADLVDQVGGELQVDAAAELKTDLLRSADALALLTGLIDDLPGADQGALIETIGELAQVQGVLSGITSALQGDLLSGAVQQALGNSLALAVGTLDLGIETLNGILTAVPAAALPIAQQALATATQQLPALLGALQGLAGSGLPGLPSLGGGSGSVEIGVDGSLLAVPVAGLCGLLPAQPFVALPGC